MIFEQIKVILGLPTWTLEINKPPITAPAPSKDAKEAATHSEVSKFSRKIKAIRARYGKIKTLYTGVSIKTVRNGFSFLAWAKTAPNVL